MFDFLRVRKSAGVRVTAPVYRLIQQGNAARARCAWLEAADAYGQALELDPKLLHIWIQLGHMSKEAGAYSVAADAYFQAARLRPDDPAVLQWLYSIAGRVGASERRRLIETLRSSQPATATTAENHSPGEAGETVFDVSDLISYFTKARLPTGIQRVQIEAIRALIEDNTARIRVCCTIEGRDEWVEVPREMFLRLADLSIKSGNCEDREWTAALNILQLHIFFSDSIEFGRNATLVNLGTSWWLQNYFLQVRNAKQKYGIRYVPFVHDLIPVMTPEHCIEGLVKDFTSWILGVFGHADGYLVASHATERDLRAAAELIGHEIPSHAIGHVPLNADIRPSIETDVPDEKVLDKFGLRGGPYVLFVSTIESRKGHTVALDAWLTLMQRHGRDVPYLVCVGNDGWLNEDVYARMDRFQILRERVIFLSRISDADLAVLYRNCRFTIYPSLYEGWGLPITEAFCHGKTVITCDNSSLVQVGKEFATFVETGSSDALAQAVERFCVGDAELEAANKHIAAKFRARPWLSIGTDIVDQTRPWSGEGGGDVRLPSIRAGCWYDLTRNSKTAIWLGAASAEVYRTGTGWGIPDERCAWIRSETARLVLPLPKTDDTLNLMLHLTARKTTEFIVMANGQLAIDGSVAADSSCWFMFALDRNAAGPVEIDIQVQLNGEEPDVALGISSFAVCASSPEDRAQLMEALLMQRFAAVEAFGAKAGCQLISTPTKAGVA
ncbi:glycosyltransferase [Novosphingobium panipatense]|uniref:glycosyltransferase family 4 protein n=1 Tax=Novosphingobium panipatense TaxID=428991 RepID=UPI0039A1FB59